MIRVLSVLKSGGDFTPADVALLREGVHGQLPQVTFECLTDMSVPSPSIELQYGWPGWWSKMELFRPDIHGDLLFFDLDSVITGPLDDIIAVDQLTLLSDFYHPAHLASGVMFLPEASRQTIWDAWIADPEGNMATYEDWSDGIHGDGRFLDELLGETAARWQDLLPGQIVSYKMHVRPAAEVDPNARVICFHGRPRPRDVWY